MDEKHESFKESVLNSEVVTQGESKEWQKYKLTEEDGNRISKEGLDLLNLDTGYYETWNAVNGPIDGTADTFEVNVTTGSSGQKTIVANQSNLNKTFINTIHTDGQDRGWKELISLPLGEEIETQNSAESRANETVTKANQYTNEQITNQHTILFEGTANGVGTVMNLSETLDNFVILYVYGRFPGGDFVVTSDPTGSSRIAISNANLIDTDGNGGGIYELGVVKTNRTRLTISNDVYFDLGSQKGSGADANKYTINKIVGVRK